MAIHTSASEKETVKIAQNIALTMQLGDIITFSGELGVGKSVLCRAIIRHLTGNPELVVPSPTFTLVQTYSSPVAELWHFDLYRLTEPDEIIELGWDEALSQITLIEWPERLGALLPEHRKRVEISEISDTVREIKIQ